MSQTCILPQSYFGADKLEMESRIAAAKSRLGKRLVILGHHYQRDDVIKFADFTGDSFRLSQQAASRPEADYIVFCGVHFMAESADVLSAPHQKVILPDLAAGCSMADMAEIDQLEQAWASWKRHLAAPPGHPDHVYEFQRRDQGILRRARRRSLHLFECRSGLQVGICQGGENPFSPRSAPGTEHRLFDGHSVGPDAGLGPEPRVWWKCPRQISSGPKCCSGKGTAASISVSLRRWWTRFEPSTPESTSLSTRNARGKSFRNPMPTGSTEKIIKVVRDAPAGTSWAVGTELHLVNRLAEESRRAGKMVVSLEEHGCLCSTMFRISPAHLLASLENLVEGRVVNQISVPERTAHWTRVALDRMLAIQ